MTSNERPYRIAVWCAVSSKAQAADDKISLEAQEEAGRELARAVGGHVVAVYRVPGHTRDIIFWQDAEREMEAYRQLREDVEAQRFDVLHAMDPDRLGRDPALSNQLVSLVEKSGAEVYLASSPHVIGQKGTGARYVFAIQSTRAGEDQQKRITYQRRGMRARIRRGLHGGHWPYGYVPIRRAGQVVGAEFDDNIDGVRLATERFLAGDTFSQIQRRMDASPFRPMKGKHWTRIALWAMLNRNSYAGILAWGEVEVQTQGDRFPILWDAETFAAIKRERRRRANARGRREGSAFIQVAFCARCGEALHRLYRNRNGQAVMGCQRHHRDSAVCHVNSVREDNVRNAIEAYLDWYSSLPVLDVALGGLEGSAAQLEAQLADIEQHIQDTEEKRRRVALAFAGGAMDLAIYRDVDDELLDELARWERERRGVEDDIDALPDLDQRRAALQALVDLESLSDLPGTEVNTALREAGICVECDGGRVVQVVIR